MFKGLTNFYRNWFLIAHHYTKYNVCHTLTSFSSLIIHTHTQTHLRKIPHEDEVDEDLWHVLPNLLQDLSQKTVVIVGVDVGNIPRTPAYTHTHTMLCDSHEYLTLASSWT